jgi:glycerol 2-dehydrogenase (NADP+)
VENGTSALFPVKPDGSRNIDRAWDQAATWAQMEALLASGKVRAIGVSNYSEQYLRRLSKSWKTAPAVNQVELHPYNPQHALKAYCDAQGILLQAYSPLGSNDSPLHADATLRAIAAKHSVEPATVLISYQVNRGVVVLPKSVTPKRIESNLKVIPLDKDDMAQLDGLAATKQQRVVSPPWGTDLGFDDWFGKGNVNAPEGTVLESQGETFEGQTFL